MTYRTKIQDGQIVVPGRLRRLAGLVEGDSLDITFESGKLILISKSRGLRSAGDRPSRTRSQKREAFLQKLRDAAPQALKKLWAESQRKGLDRITQREINAEIAAYRKERRQRKQAVTPPA